MAKRKPLKIKIKTPLEKTQANLFLNVFRKANIKRRGSRSMISR